MGDQRTAQAFIVLCTILMSFILTNLLIALMTKEYEKATNARTAQGEVISMILSYPILSFAFVYSTTLGYKYCKMTIKK